MVSRHYLRIKTMQALYSYNANPKASMAQAETDLEKSIRACHELFVWLFCLLPEITFYRLKKLESLKGKYNPTEEDLNPNTKFVDNVVIKGIEECQELEALKNSYHVNWDDDTDLISKLYRQVEQLPEYETYMSKSDRSFNEDKLFVLTIIEKVFANNELLNWHLGEINLHWINDYNEAITMLYQNVKSFTEKEPFKIDGIYADADAKVLARNLFRKTLQNADEYKQLINSKLQNWELGRIINMDILLMEMALCELLEFPSIPIKVTLNEYIEISKWYSSDKSKVFINGILDRLIVDLRESGRIVKTGRGLYQN